MRAIRVAIILVFTGGGIISRGVCAGQGAPAQRVDPLFSQYNNSASPGLVIAVVRDGKVLLSKGYGLANLEYRVPITSSTVFDVASVSKQFTGLAVAMLVEQGKISLSDDIRKYIPELHPMGPTITINHLLHHTSGLRDWPATLAVAGWDFGDVYLFKQILGMAYNQKTLNFPPGSEYSYSNTEYNLLAEMIARVTGQSFRTWTDQNIFAPLRMTNTHFRDDYREVIPNRAYGYDRVSDHQYSASTDDLEAYGSSSLFTTADDLTKWVTNFDQPTVGGAAAIQLMQTRGVLNDGSSIPYAFGIVHGVHRGLATVSHDGGWASFSTFVGRFPQQRFGVIVLANCDCIDATNEAYKVADIYLEKEEVASPEPADVPGAKKASVVVTPAVLDTYTGLYRLGQGWYVRVRRVGSELKTQATREPEFPMTPQSQGEFWVEGYRSTMAFQRDAASGITYLTYHGQRHPQLEESPALTPSDVEGFAGEYCSDELQTCYRVEAHDGTLVMQHPRYGAMPLTRLWRDEFSGNAWFMNVEFQRDGTGKPVGFFVNAGTRSRQNHFVRRYSRAPTESQGSAPAQNFN